MLLHGNISAALLSPEDATSLEVKGHTKAGVLVPVFERDDELHIVFTRRREDLRNHPGEISFPGGRRDYPTEPLLQTALREASEEIGLKQESVHLLGALRPLSTFVTGFAVYPFVGLIPPTHSWVPNQAEVAEMIELPLAYLQESRQLRRMIRHGLPFRTAVYPINDDQDVIWGATARILDDLIERIAAGV